MILGRGNCKTVQSVCMDWTQQIKKNLKNLSFALQINSLALPSANYGLNKDAEELFLFDPKVISSIDMSKAKCKFAPGINAPSNPTDGFVVRPLSSKDYDRGKIQRVQYCDMRVFCHL